MIRFNQPFETGKEIIYFQQALKAKKLSGDYTFTKKCHEWFKEEYNLNKTLLTTSCTDALEMTAILLNIKEGDEIIIPSFTFVSTANAFRLRGAKIIFADSGTNNPNLDTTKLEPLITKRTKAIVPVHYAGIACDMDEILNLAKKYNLYVVEDAAQGIDSYYKGLPLGSIGHFGTFSFHETKNVTSGEGGLLIINDEKFEKRAEIIREKGTNRSAFFRGEIDKYGWVDIGSSFLPSDITAAFLLAQLESIEFIQKKRINHWNQYYQKLKHLEEENFIQLPYIPDYATNNAHMFYLICKSITERTNLINHLKENGVHAVFHYLSLHKSVFYKDKHDGRDLQEADRYSSCLLRLPMFVDLTNSQIELITNSINQFYGK